MVVLGWFNWFSKLLSLWANWVAMHDTSLAVSFRLWFVKKFLNINPSPYNFLVMTFIGLRYNVLVMWMCLAAVTVSLTTILTIIIIVTFAQSHTHLPISILNYSFHPTLSPFWLVDVPNCLSDLKLPLKRPLLHLFFLKKMVIGECVPLFNAQKLGAFLKIKAFQL